MINKVLGTALIKITSQNLDKTANEIYNTCKVKTLYKENESLYIAVNSLYFDYFIDFICKNKYNYEIVYVKGIYFIAKKYLKRFGICLGIVLGLIFTAFLSDIALKFESKDDINDDLKDEIVEILDENGIKLGGKISEMNFESAEISILSGCEEISFASIAHENSVIKIDVDLFDEKAYSERRRIPSNIVASENAIIVDTVVRSGTLEVLIGEAVSKGDVLVSGIEEYRNNKTYYLHSSADIIAEYSKTMRFYVPYSSQRRIKNSTWYNLSIILFDTEFPFIRYRDKEIDFEIERNFSVFGFEFPIGYSYSKLSDYIYVDTEISTDEAIKRANMIANNFEKYILKDVKIKSKEYEVIYLSEGVVLEAKYDLIGDIGVQKFIYAK